MAGHVLTESIVVNYKAQDKDDSIHFLTHVDPAVTELSRIVSPTAKRVYTSKYNAWYLVTYLGGSPDVFIGMNSEESYKVEFNGHKFIFALIESHYNTGSVMIVLHGGFGTIFYTGYLSYYPGILSSPILQSIMKKKALTKLYLDTTYYEQVTGFQNMLEVTNKLINMVKSMLPKKIYIYCKYWGLEKVLIDIAESVNELLLIDEKTMAIMKHLEMDHLFTCDSRKASHIFMTSSFRTKRYHSEGEEYETIVLEHVNNPGPAYKSYICANKMHKFKFYCHPTHAECCTIINSFMAESLIPIGNNDFNKKIIYRPNVPNQKTLTGSNTSEKEVSMVRHPTIGHSKNSAEVTLEQECVNLENATDSSSKKKVLASGKQESLINFRISPENKSICRTGNQLLVGLIPLENYTNMAENKSICSIANNVVTVPVKKIIQASTTTNPKQNETVPLLSKSKKNCELKRNDSYNASTMKNGEHPLENHFEKEATFSSDKVNLKIRKVDEINKSVLRQNENSNENSLQKNGIKIVTSLKRVGSGNKTTMKLVVNENNLQQESSTCEEKTFSNFSSMTNKFTSLSTQINVSGKESNKDSASSVTILKNITGVENTDTKAYRINSNNNVCLQSQSDCRDESDLLPATDNSGKMCNEIGFKRTIKHNQNQIIDNHSKKILTTLNVKCNNEVIIVDKNPQNYLLEGSTKPCETTIKTNVNLMLKSATDVRSEVQQTEIGNLCCSVALPTDRSTNSNPSGIRFPGTISSQVNNNSIMNMQSTEAYLSNNEKSLNFEKSNLSEAIVSNNTINFPTAVVMNPVVLPSSSNQESNISGQNSLKINSIECSDNRVNAKPLINESDVVASYSYKRNIQLSTDSVEVHNYGPLVVSHNSAIKASQLTKIPVTNIPERNSPVDKNSLHLNNLCISYETKQQFAKVSDKTSGEKPVIFIIPKDSDVNTLNKTLSSIDLSSSNQNINELKLMESENCHGKKLYDNLKIDTNICTSSSNVTKQNDEDSMTNISSSVRMLEKEQTEKSVSETSVEMSAMTNLKRKNIIFNNDESSKKVKHLEMSVTESNITSAPLLHQNDTNQSNMDNNVDHKNKQNVSQSNVKGKIVEAVHNKVIIYVTGDVGVKLNKMISKKKVEEIQPMKTLVENKSMCYAKKNETLNTVNEIISANVTSGTFHDKMENKNQNGSCVTNIECSDCNNIQKIGKNNTGTCSLSNDSFPDVGTVSIKSKTLVKSFQNESSSEFRIDNIKKRVGRPRIQFKCCGSVKCSTSKDIKLNQRVHKNAQDKECDNLKTVLSREKKRESDKSNKRLKTNLSKKNLSSNEKCEFKLTKKYNPYVKLDRNYLRNTGYVYSLRRNCFILRKNTLYNNAFVKMLKKK